MLTDQERSYILAKCMDELSRINESISVNKIELREAIDATDNWIEANQASFNSALPTEARTKLTAPQKARLFMYVALKRYEVG